MGRKHTIEELNDNANNYFAKEKVYDAISTQEKLGTKSYLAYVEADSFIGNPYSLLGRVIMIRKSKGKCPEGINDKGFISEFAPLPIPGIVVDNESKIERPIKRGSIVVTKDLSLKVGFLSYLNGEFTANTSFSIMVFDQMTGLVDVQSPSWQEGLNQWILNNTYLLQDPDICYLYAVVGLVQKNVIRKKFKKLNTKIKGGAYGINVNGELYTSNDEYFLDIRFGLTPVILKSPTFKIQLPKKELIEKMQITNDERVIKSTKAMVDFSLKHSESIKYSLPNEDELGLFSNINTL